MLRIWGRTNSVNVQKVLWCWHELGLDYQRIDAGNDFGVTDTPEYIAMNPNRLVPTIDDGDIQLWESNVIVRYLAQKHGDGWLCPADIATRFDAERWMDWQATVFWPALRPLFIALIRAPQQHDAAVISKGESLSLSALRVLDARLSHRTFLAGDAFSMGDIPADTRCPGFNKAPKRPRSWRSHSIASAAPPLIAHNSPASIVRPLTTTDKVRAVVQSSSIRVAWRLEITAPALIPLLAISSARVFRGPRKPK